MFLASDNSGPVHPRIMDALQRANSGHAMGYGNDVLTQKAADRIRAVFEAPEAAVYFVATGTAANALILATMAHPFQTIYCAPDAHVAVDECGAPEFYTSGAKLAHVAGLPDRMTAAALTQVLAAADTSVHAVQPGPVTITQVTEWGTLYELDEIRAIADVTHSYGQKLHLDGARFANAAAALGCSAAEMSWKQGVDAVSFGGTKNGCLGVEAVVIFDPDLAWEFELRRKRGGHLFSKNRFLAAQMDAYASDDLWLDMARAANANGSVLAQALADLDQVWTYCIRYRRTCCSPRCRAPSMHASKMRALSTIATATRTAIPMRRSGVDWWPTGLWIAARSTSSSIWSGAD